MVLPWSEQEVPRRVTDNRARLWGPPLHTLAYESKENYCPSMSTVFPRAPPLASALSPSSASNPGARQPFFQKLFLSRGRKGGDGLRASHLFKASHHCRKTHNQRCLRQEREKDLESQGRADTQECSLRGGVPYQTTPQQEGMEPQRAGSGKAR